MTTDIAPASSSEPSITVTVEPDFDIDDGAEPKAKAAASPTRPPAAPIAAALPIVPATPSPAVALAPDQSQRFLERITTLTTEARAIALEQPAAAAPLWFEAGRLYEHELANLRDAAIHYQEAHRADPGYVPVIHAARRLFGQLGKWGMVVMLIDEEVRLPGAQAASLLIEKARIHESKLARPEDAVTIYRQVLALEPHNVIAVDAVVRALGARGAFADVVEVLAAAAAAADRDNLKAAWLIEAARLAETRLGDDARALDLIDRADALIPNRRPVLEMRRRLAARRGDVERQAQILESLADISASPADAVSFLMEQARVASGDGTNEGLRRAVAALEEARERSPSDTAVLAELCRLYERLEMWSSLADCFEARSLASTEHRERLAWAADAARIAEERLNESERAIRLYRSVVEVDATDQLALAALGRLFARTRRFDDLSHVYDIQLETTTDPQQKIPLLFKHAELLAFSMDDVDSALSRLREILAISPGYVPASKLAASLYTRLGRHAELVDLWETELATNVDKDQGLFLLEKIAGVCEEHLHNVDRAIGAYVRMEKLQSGHLPALRSLARLYGAAERWEDLIKVVEEEAQTVGDQNVIVSLWFRHGEVLAEKLGRTDDAVASFNRALQLMPTYLPALKALGGIYARAGRWNDLVAMHRAEAEVARRAEQRAHLLYIAAELLEIRVVDVDAAIKTYLEVLEEAPSHHPALRALKRIAVSRGDDQMLLTTLTRELAVLTDGRERGNLRCQLAELLERRLGRVDDAVAALEDAVREAPGLLVAHEALVSLHSRHHRAGDEASARERLQGVLPEEETRVANLRAIADLALHRLDDPARALDALRRLLVLVPDDRPALRGSLVCALRLRDHRAAIAAATSLAAVEPSADEVCNLHLQIATWREGHVDPPEDPLPEYVRMLEFQPQHPIALRALERLYVERRAWAALYALYARESEALSEPRLVVATAMKMGELAENRLGQLELARAAYERAHAAMRDYLPAISRLKDIYGKEGRPQDQLRLLTLEAQTSKDPAHAVRTLLEVGALQRDRFGDVDAAVDCFSRVLDRDPLHGQAYPSLEGLLVGANRFGALAGLYERRADALAGDATTPQRIELLSRAALLQVEREQNLVEGVRLYERVIQLAPQHAGALHHLGTIAFAARDWDRAIAAWSALLPVATDPVALVPVHFSLGAIFLDHRPDPARAVQHLTAGLAMQPEHRQARMQLARAFGAAGSPAQAAQTYKQLLDSAVDPSERRDIHLVMARLFSAMQPDPAQAIVHLEAALGLIDDRADQGRILDELGALYERTGNLQGLVDSGTRQAEALVATQPRRAAELHFRNARIAAERLNNVDLALKCARRAAELAPDVVEVRGFIADLYSKTPNQQALAVEEHRRIMRSGRIRIASLKSLFKAFSMQRAHDRAFCAAELLSFLAAADDGEELYFSDNKKRLKKESAEALDAGQLTSWVAHPLQRTPVRDILAAVAADLGKPFAATDLEALDKKFILRPKAQDPLRTMADNLAHNVGVSGFDVWRSQERKSGVFAIAGNPSLILVGADVTRTHPSREQRFLLGRKVMALASGHHLLAGLDARGLATLMTGIGRAVDKTFPMLAGADATEVDAMAKKVGSAISRKARGQITEAVAQLATSPRIDFAAFLAGVPLSENRAGLLLSGAFDAAARLVARDVGVNLAGDTTAMIANLESNPALGDLIAFMLSDEHFSARQGLKLAIDS